MIKYFLTLVFLLVLPCQLALASAEREEHISNFESTITVNPDASIDVIEKITVYANGNQIKHGLMRWLPTSLTDTYGITHHPDYQIQKILLNDHISAYHTETNGNQLIVYIGMKDVVLNPGYYTYTLGYHVDDAVNFLSDGDELYWNVTGNDWNFAILKSQTEIILPEGAKILSYQGYVGMRGEKDGKYTVNEAAPNRIIFTTGYLAEKTGITIAIAWPKGFVHEPTPKEQLARAFEVNRKHALLLEIAGIVLLYYLSVWFLYGKDPKAGTIIPLFDPPQRLSPAAMRYIMRMGFDMKTFTAAIVSLATKQFITIENEYDDYTLKKIDNDDSALSLDEVDLEKALFTAGDSLHLVSTNASTVKNAKSKLKAALKSTFQSPYFKLNRIYLVPGIAFTAAAFVLAVITAKQPPVAIFSIVWLLIWGFVCFGLIAGVWASWKQLFNYFSVKNFVVTLFTTFITLAFLAGFLIGLAFLTSAIEIFTVPVLFFIIALNVVFYHLMKIPTREGRNIMDQIEGFKLFLSTTERYRLNAYNAPKQTPALFEKYLPYAIALDVENEWGESFNASLREAGIQPSSYHPTWYSGVWTSNTIATFPAFLGTGLNSALASASVSSSASGGSGGSSGGGSGGGGGGGGW